MARIRTVKPEIWTDEKFVELSPLARLLFIGLWNFADDYGRMQYSPTRIKLQILPADSAEPSQLLDELRQKSLLVVYSIDGKEYLQINGWEEHQKIDKRSASKYPAPRNLPPNSAEPSREIALDQGREGTKEGIKEGSTAATAAVAKPAVPPCPHLEIIKLYTKHLPMGRQVNPGLWSGTRAKHLATRWKEDPERQNLAWWDRFFAHCATSEFLTGQKHSPGRDPFLISLDWIVEPTNFVRIHEGHYTRRKAD